MMAQTEERGRFPVSAGILFGLGLGGFFDGIVLHQLLQWHHMASSWHPADTVGGLEFNTLLDGFFHAATYIFVVAGLIVLWRAAHRRHLIWSTKQLVGSMLLGFGLFNTIEGLMNHLILGVHHVNETVPREQWLAWDLGFLASGLVMIALGWWILRAGQREDRARARPEASPTPGL